jgi:hypothetical protein
MAKPKKPNRPARCRYGPFLQDEEWFMASMNLKGDGYALERLDSSGKWGPPDYSEFSKAAARELEKLSGQCYELPFRIRELEFSLERERQRNGVFEEFLLDVLYRDSDVKYEPLALISHCMAIARNYLEMPLYRASDDRIITMLKERSSSRLHWPRRRR